VATGGACETDNDLLSCGLRPLATRFLPKENCALVSAQSIFQTAIWAQISFGKERLGIALAREKWTSAFARTAVSQAPPVATGRGILKGREAP